MNNELGDYFQKKPDHNTFKVNKRREKSAFSGRKDSLLSI